MTKIMIAISVCAITLLGCVQTTLHEGETGRFTCKPVFSTDSVGSAMVDGVGEMPFYVTFLVLRERERTLYVPWCDEGGEGPISLNTNTVYDFYVKDDALSRIIRKGKELYSR